MKRADTNNNDLHKALMKLRFEVVRCGYTDLYPIYGSLHSEELRNYPVIEKQVADLTDPLRAFAQVFLLGRSCAIEIFEFFFDKQEMEALLANQVFEVDAEGQISSSLVLAVFMGCLIFFERRLSGQDIRCYIGDDSLALASHLIPPQGARCLDLCTGSGIQALLCSSKGGHVIGVELQEKAVEIARINLMLNGCDARVEIRRGNLYDVVTGEVFDFICANPPLLPAAADIRNPIVSNGGEDGIRLIRQILKGLPYHLSTKGICQLIGTSLGDDYEPYFAEELAQIYHEVRVSFTVFFSAAYPVDAIVEPLAGNSALFCGESFEKAKFAYQSLFRRQNATCLYPFFLTAVQGSGTKVEPRIVRLYKSTRKGFWTVLE